jgi:hypothetical protein
VISQDQGTTQTSNEEVVEYREKTYKSSDVLLSVIQNEYTNEADRKRDLETRSGIFIALLGALVGFYAGQIDFSYFKNPESSIELLFFILVSIFSLLPAVMMLFALKNLIDVLKVKEYQRIGLGGFSETSAKKPKDEIEFKLALSYKSVVETNGISNDEKAKQFKKGVNKIFIAVLGIIVFYLLKEILLVI